MQLHACSNHSRYLTCAIMSCSNYTWTISIFCCPNRSAVSPSCVAGLAWFCWSRAATTTFSSNTGGLNGRGTDEDCMAVSKSTQSAGEYTDSKRSGLTVYKGSATAMHVYVWTVIASLYVRLIVMCLLQSSFSTQFGHFFDLTTHMDPARLEAVTRIFFSAVNMAVVRWP